MKILNSLFESGLPVDCIKVHVPSKYDSLFDVLGALFLRFIVFVVR